MTASTTTVSQVEDLEAQAIVMRAVQEYLDALAAKEVEYRMERKAAYFAETPPPDPQSSVTASMIDYYDNRSGSVFEIETTTKYIKVFSRDRIGDSGSIHAFVDKRTGDVYKPAGLKAPAKHVRFNLLDPDSKAAMFERLDIFGGYLYL